MMMADALADGLVADGAHGCGGVAMDGGKPYDLFDVYRAIARAEWGRQTFATQRGFELALNKVLKRISRDGASVLRFASMFEVLAYAKRVLVSTLLDAKRRFEVECRYLDASTEGGQYRGGDPLSLPPSAVEYGAFAQAEREEVLDWLVACVGAADAELLMSLHVDGRSFNEVVVARGAKESTLRGREKRASERVAAGWERDGVRATRRTGGPGARRGVVRVGAGW